MNRIDQFDIDPTLDLVLEREVDVPPEYVWEAWTTPAHIRAFFVPKPWTVADCRIDLRPGGEFYSLMRSPQGQEFPNTGCYLELVENRKLVWTSALMPGYRPPVSSGDAMDLPFTAVILMEPFGAGTRYTALAIHPDEAGRKRHEDMGFHQGWSTVVDQMVEYMQQVKGQ